MPWILLRVLVRRTFASCFMGLCWNQAGVPWKCAVSAAGRGKKKQTPFETSIISCEWHDCCLCCCCWKRSLLFLGPSAVFEPRLWSPSCTMPIFCCPWAAVWIRVDHKQSYHLATTLWGWRALLNQKKTLRWSPFWSPASQSVNVQRYKLQGGRGCDSVFPFHSQWPMMIGVLWCSLVFCSLNRSTSGFYSNGFAKKHLMPGSPRREREREITGKWRWKWGALHFAGSEDHLFEGLPHQCLACESSWSACAVNTRTYWPANLKMRRGMFGIFHPQKLSKHHGDCHQRQAILSALPGGKALHGAPWRSLLSERWKSALDRRDWPCHRIGWLVWQWAASSRTGRTGFGDES